MCLLHICDQACAGGEATTLVQEVICPCADGAYRLTLALSHTTWRLQLSSYRKGSLLSAVSLKVLCRLISWKPSSSMGAVWKATEPGYQREPLILSLGSSLFPGLLPWSSLHAFLTVMDGSSLKPCSSAKLSSLKLFLLDAKK